MTGAAESVSAAFLADPASWLGSRLDAMPCKVEVIPLKEALMRECEPGKGGCVREFLRNAIADEKAAIEALPSDGQSLRGDQVEKLRKREKGGEERPSVDVYLRMPDCLMLVECKYRAHPDTAIVKSVEAFDRAVMRKFRASREFLACQGCRALAEDSVVLFNAESKEKVLSMFLRLQLQDDRRTLRSFRILDTCGFRDEYMKTVALSQ